MAGVRQSTEDDKVALWFSTLGRQGGTSRTEIQGHSWVVLSWELGSWSGKGEINELGDRTAVGGA